MPTTETPLLQAHEVGVRFAVRGGWWQPAQYVHAVRQVSFELAAGETLAVVGESGSGKTTLARALMGLVPVHEGHFVFAGQRIQADQPQAWRELRRQVQMVFQDPFESIDARRTVLQTVVESLVSAGVAGSALEHEQIALRALESVGLLPAASVGARFAHELSGGQRQRVAIAAAMVLSPKVLVADEPVSMLDVSLRAGVLRLIADLTKTGVGCLFITHDLSLAWMFADRIAVLYLGRIVEEGPAESVIAAPKHPYTRALVSVIPGPHREATHKPEIGRAHV